MDYSPFSALRQKLENGPPYWFYTTIQSHNAMSTHCFIVGISRSSSVELVMFGKVRLAFVTVPLVSVFVDKEPGENRSTRKRSVEIFCFSCVEKFTKLVLLLLM